MALFVLGSRCYWRDGPLCLAVAASHCKDASINGLYVQGYEFDFCVIVFRLVVWRVHHLEQCRRGRDYHYWNYSFCKVMIYYLLVVLSVLAAASAQMLLKQGARKSYPTFWQQYINRWVIVGYGIMGLSMLLNIFCLSHGVQVKEVSIIESLSYLFVPLLSWMFFKEGVTWRKAGAIALIMFGVVVFFK